MEGALRLAGEALKRMGSHCRSCDPRLMVLFYFPLPEQVQCHTYTGYCWCVTPDGKPISGSSVQNKTPVCSGTVGKGGKKKEGWGETPWPVSCLCGWTFERLVVVMSSHPGQGGVHLSTLALLGAG